MFGVNLVEEHINLDPHDYIVLLSLDWELQRKKFGFLVHAYMTYGKRNPAVFSISIEIHLNCRGKC